MAVQQQQQQQPDVSMENVVSQGLRCIRQLRQQTHRSLEFLRDGVLPQNDDVLSDEQIFIKEAKQRLAGVMESYEQLDKLTTVLPKPPQNFGGNLNYLMQNTISEGPFASEESSRDSSASYDDVLGTYNWLQRSNEYSQLTIMFVGQYLRRNQSKLFKRPIPVTGFTIQQLNQQLLPAFVKLAQSNQIELQFTTLNRGRNTVLIFVNVGTMAQQIQGSTSTVIRVVLLARLNPFSLEWANVKGSDEDFYDDNGKLDTHSPSRYRVFQKLTNHVKGAILHHMGLINSPGQLLQTSLRTFFAWLGMYKKLFTEPCANCKHVLRDYLPPYCRDYRKIDQAFHEACK